MLQSWFKSNCSSNTVLLIHLEYMLMILKTIIRREVWPYLLGHIKFGQSEAEIKRRERWKYFYLPALPHLLNTSSDRVSTMIRSSRRKLLIIFNNILVKFILFWLWVPQLSIVLLITCIVSQWLYLSEYSELCSCKLFISLLIVVNY